MWNPERARKNAAVDIGGDQIKEYQPILRVEDNKLNKGLERDLGASETAVGTIPACFKTLTNGEHKLFNEVVKNKAVEFEAEHSVAFAAAGSDNKGAAGLRSQ